MALFNIFQKKKKPEPRKTEKIKKEDAAPKPKKTVEVAVPRPKKISGQAYKTLKKPRVTEKAADLTSKNQYIFEVFQNSNKNQIKKSVEDVYGVDVVSVNILKIPGKKRRLGRITGWKSGGKKAIVKIREGQKIEVLPR